MDDDAADEEEAVDDDATNEDEVVDAALDRKTGLELGLEVGSEDTVGEDVAASVDVEEIGTGGKRVAATLPGSGMVPVISLNKVHSSPL